MIEQLELTLEEEETAARASSEEPVADDAEQPEKAQSKPSRQPLSAHLPREDELHEAPSVCPACGEIHLRKQGEDNIEVLDYIPAFFRVLHHRRPKYVCSSCDETVQAPVPSRPITRGKLGPGLLAHLMVGKYGNYPPLYRQAQIYERDGVNLSRSTLADWVGRCTELLARLIGALERHALSADRVHGGDTPVPVLDPGRSKTKQGRLWAYVKDGRPWNDGSAPAVRYFYGPDRQGRHPQGHLKHFKGVPHAPSRLIAIAYPVGQWTAMPGSKNCTGAAP